MLKSKLLKVIVGMGLSMSLLVGCGGSQAASSTDSEYIVMGTNAAFEPFEYREGSQVVGFDVDIAQAVADKLGKKLKVEDMEFNSLIVQLNAKQIDFIAAGMTVDEERLKQVDFSDTYFKTKQVIIVKADDTSIQEPKDLAGKKVGVQLATTGDQYVSKEEDVEVVRFDKGAIAIMDLVNGKIDAVVIDSEPAKKMIEGQSNLKILDASFVDEEYAIAVNKGDTELLQIINETLAELKANGEYDKIYAKYFDETK